MFCAVNEDEVVRKSDIALACNASENHLGQVVRLLAHHGFIDAYRGRHGGMQLATPASEINIGSVFRLFESDMPFAECFSRQNSCPLVEACWLKDAIRNAVNAFYASLDRITLADLVADNQPLQALLSFQRIENCAERDPLSA